jgi:hypothetical protein
MAAVRYNITLSNGRTFTLRVACKVENDDDTLDVRNLAGWTGAMQVRATADDATVLAEADVTIDTADGIVTATITDDETVSATWRAGVYDLIITDGTDTEPLAEGTVLLRRSVTR